MTGSVIALVAAGLCLALIAAPPADAKVKRVPSTIAAVYVDQDEDLGEVLVLQVKSKVAACEKRRKVSLVPSDDGVFEPVPQWRGGGEYMANSITVPAEYVARVKPKRIGKGSKRRLCKGDSSGKITTTDGGSVSISLNFEVGAPPVFNGTFQAEQACLVDRFITLYRDTDVLTEYGGAQIEVTGPGEGQFSIDDFDAYPGGTWSVYPENRLAIKKQKGGGASLTRCQQAESIGIPMYTDVPAITIGYTTNLFEGASASSYEECDAGRAISLTDDAGTVGTDVTDGDGWSVAAGGVAGMFYVVNLDSAVNRAAQGGGYVYCGTTFNSLLL